MKCEETIALLNLVQPCEPRPTSKMDAMHALDLLTEDGWREVFKKVRCPEDLKSCCEACTTFEGILGGKKTTWIFPTILPHILPYLHVATGRLLPPFRNWNGLYNCRRVCRGWRQTVDRYLESHNNYFQGITRPTSDDYFLHSGREHNIGAFYKMFEDFTGNPFIGRYAHIYHTGLVDHPPEDPNQQDPYTVGVQQVLDRFGNEIWSLCLMDFMRRGCLSFCKNIQILLGKLRNLKSLQLRPQVNLIEEDPELSQLPAFLAANPLPDHPNLESLVLNRLSNRMVGPLLEKYGPQLKRLQMHCPQSFADKVNRFQCLEGLEIHTCDRNDGLNSLRQLRSPLSSLHIIVNTSGGGTCYTWPIHELIRDVLHLPLTDLWIHCWTQFEGKVESFPTSLQHGSIRKVRIAGRTTSSLSCNFLLCFPNLEEIHFEYQNDGIPQPGHGHNLLIVTASEEDMYESPVWDVIPSLRLISVRTARWPKVYRRSTFEMRRLEKRKEILAELF